jgi:capsular polysaccharide transport system ATP-binding protein
MIRLENLTKGFWVRDKFRPVIDNLSMDLPDGKSMALLGRNGAGKSTLLQMIAGTMRPTSGRVVREGSISWPIGAASSFHKDMTGAQNTRFLARVYGVDCDELAEFVKDFAEIGQHFYMPLRSYSSGMRSRLAFGVAMGISFDTYLIDEVTAVGDARFKRKSREVFHDRIRSSGAILVSHSMADARNYCDSGLILHDGRLEFYDDVNHAIRRYLSLMA